MTAPRNAGSSGQRRWPHIAEAPGIGFVLLLVGLSLAALVHARAEVASEAVVAYQAEQQIAATALADRVGARWTTLAHLAAFIDPAALPAEDDASWLRVQATRFGVHYEEAELVVTGPDGNVLAATSPAGPFGHLHVGGDGAPCLECLGEGVLAFAAPQDAEGRQVHVLAKLAYEAGTLRERWAWVVSPDGAIGAHGDTAQVGTRPFDPARDDPRLTDALARMRAGEHGNALYSWSAVGSDRSEERLAAFAPLGEAAPGWALAISAPADAALEGVTGALGALAWALGGTVASVAVAGLAIHFAFRRQREAALQERLQLAEAAGHAERLALVGTLTAGIAHDLKNPLTVLMAALDLAKDGIDGDSTEDAKAAVGQIASLARDLHEFTKGHCDTAACRPCEAAAVAARLAGPALRSGKVLTIELDGVPPVSMPGRHLSQVLLNLLVNAAHAGRHIAVSATWNPESVEILVEDDGPGVDASIAPRLFSAFATTKAAGEGTGLGLFMCHRLVEQAGGKIDVDRGRLGGARFRVRLPAAAVALAQAP